MSLSYGARGMSYESKLLSVKGAGAHFKRQSLVVISILFGIL